MAPEEKEWKEWSKDLGPRKRIVKSMVGNSYGHAQVWTCDDTFWFGIETHKGLRGHECSKDFYDAFVNEWTERYW